MNQFVINNPIKTGPCWRVTVTNPKTGDTFIGHASSPIQAVTLIFTAAETATATVDLPDDWKIEAHLLNVWEL